MRSKATHPHHHIFTRSVRAFAGLFALVFLLLATSQQALAQDRVLKQETRSVQDAPRVLKDYRALEAAAEEAKEMHALEPTGRTESIMNRAVDTFQQFEETNRDAIQQAMRGPGGPAYTFENATGPFTCGGPDAFGYTCISSEAPGGPTFQFINATAGAAAKTNGILVAVGDDASSVNSGIFAPVGLGTAPFNFYGVDYFDAVPATNGYISMSDPLDGGPDLSNDCPIPAAASTPVGTTAGRIYPLHDDMVAGGGFGDPTGGIFWEYFASCPHPHSSGGCDVFHYNNANHFGSGTFFDYEVILFDNNDIIFQYGAGNPEQGASSTTGIQNQGPVPDDASLYSCNTFADITDDLAILFVYPDLSTADLSVTKTVDDTAPEVGDNVTFTITVTNEQGGAVFARVNDLLPGGLTYVSSTVSQGSYNAGNGDWQVGTIGIGGSATMTITATVEISGTITNVAFIAFADLPDPNTGNNRAEASVNPVAADLTLTKRVTDFSTDEGVISATFEVEVSNQGPNDVCGVEVTDSLSPGMTLEAVSVSQGLVVLAGSDIIWGVGCLDVGDSATLTVSVTVPADGNLVNTAEVTDSDLPDPDSEVGDGEGDDFALATAAPRRAADFVPEAGPGGVIDRGDRFTADLKVDKTVDVTTAPVGGTVVYTIAVMNQGPQSTAKVVVTDHLPDCLTLDEATADRGTYDGWEWDIGKIKVDETVTLTVTATVGDACEGTVTNVAEVTSSSLPDPDDAFNLFDEPPIEDEIGEASFDVEPPTESGLAANYPNPFNPETIVPYSLREASHVSIHVYDLLGRSVATLVDGEMPAGKHEVRFDGSYLSTGVYLVRMQVAGQVFTQRITLMK